MTLELLTVNLSGKVRRETLFGRPHLVAPISLIVPDSVLNGSQGPLLYPRADTAAATSAWNGMPITVNHPKDAEGNAISARSPSVLDSVSIGTVLNAEMNGKLGAEAWLDIERTQLIDNRIIQRLQAGKPIEISTGLFTDNEPKQGIAANGVPYVAVARNHRPDHLAFLPDDVGACSVRDGCGVLVNGAFLRGITGVSGDHAHIAVTDTTGNGNTQTNDGHNHQIIDFVVQPADGHTHSLSRDELTENSQSVSGTVTTITPDWRIVTMAKLNDAQRKEAVDSLINNCSCWAEDDREVLNALPDAKLTALTEANRKARDNEAVLNTVKEGYQDDDGNQVSFDPTDGTWTTKFAQPKEVEPVANKKGDDGYEGKGSGGGTKKPPKPLTNEEWLATAPSDIRSAVQNAMAIEAAEKGNIITLLTANLEGDEQKRVATRLNGMPLDSLRDMALLVPKADDKGNVTAQPVGNYFGASAPARSPKADPSFNKDDILPLPTINWAKEVGKTAQTAR